ncbi:hypothetical protein H2200_000578 [Cladophialophora chaetospira]|uniref:TEA domain-containing protein n=1 Tax=Cladophialophora chaetospira TaxID=386627 RepID=A0AA38XNN8_9EURO|nr:hypothetical protein H2200_000578 [Cladophialophora chaetospira]
MDCIPSGVAAQLHFGEPQAAAGHLSVSSGNAQLLPLQQTEGTENQYPLPSLSSGRHTPQQFPIPSLKLGSNDGSSSALEVNARRHQLKSRRSKQIDVERPYLLHPKYIEYRSRTRLDIGKDGKPIWPDHIENAFQDALVHIKPMGRRKCSQRGKPFGRNMLIAEWILRATGHKRERKQVSSHIQVLDRFLAGIPEWDRLIKAGDDDDTGPADGHKFYHNSIEHMVNEQTAKKEIGWEDDLDDADESFLSPSSATVSDLSHPVEQLNFEMWVSSPVDQDRALHYYTGLGSEKLGSLPLEELAGWRLSFPRLSALVDRRKRLHNCDLVLLNTSFKLMQEFPPPRSKLGIGLELKFPDPLLWQGQGDADFKKWCCTTYMYQDGVLVAEPNREECQVSEQEHWKVRPFFQSKWWASTFTSLTEARKVAEDSKDPDAIELANQESRNFFQGLSIMQEISAVRYINNVGPFGNNMRRDARKRMAILLWKFSQAPADSPGTTTWQNLVVPPERLTTNSPLPAAGTETDLPALSMDSIVSPGNGSFDSNSHFFPQHDMQYDYHESLDDSFMGLKPEQIHDFDHLHSSFDLPTTHEFSGVDPSLHDTFQLPDNLQTANGNLFDSAHAHMQSNMDSLMFNDSQSAAGHHAPDVPLSRFDITTHQLLQEQLKGKDERPNDLASHSPHIKSEPSPQLSHIRTWSQQLEDDEKMLRKLAAHQIQEKQAQRLHEARSQLSWPAHADEQEEALRNALLAASAMSDLGSGAHQPQTPRSHLQHGAPGQLQLHDDRHWVSPMPLRPPLQSYHSFPGMRHDGHMHRLSFGAGHHGDDLSLSEPLPQLDPHHSFMDHQLSAVSAPEDFLHASDPIDEGPSRLTRGHSEPDLSAAAAIDCFSSDPHLPVTDGVVEGHLQDTSQPDSLAPEDLNLGGSFVEVSMEDVQG